MNNKHSKYLAFIDSAVVVSDVFELQDPVDRLCFVNDLYPLVSGVHGVSVAQDVEIFSSNKGYLKRK